jgi:hypothetical protein
MQRRFWRLSVGSILLSCRFQITVEHFRVVGNEAGNYKATQRNLSTWNTDTYIAEWLVRHFLFIYAVQLG